MNYQQVEFETSFGFFNQLPKSTNPEIAFAGRSNVGKSSMINRIFQRKNLARVSSVPGKTATINFFKLQNVRFVDLPGYGFAKVSKGEKERWSELIEGYFANDRNIALVLALLDFRHKPSKDDILMINYLIENEFPFIIVLTKADKLSAKQRVEMKQQIIQSIPFSDQITMVEFSSQTGEGVLQLREIFDEIAQEDAQEENTGEEQNSSLE